MNSQGQGYPGGSNGFGDRGNTDYSPQQAPFRTNPGYGNLMRGHDPYSGGAGGSDHNSGGDGSGLDGRGMQPPHPGRGMPMSPSARLASGRSRRGTTTATRMPSMRLMPTTGPMEPVVTDGVLSTAGMHGVAVGALYESDSYSGGGSTRNTASSNRYPPSNPGGGGGGHTNQETMRQFPPRSSLNHATSIVGNGTESVGVLPDAPYQELMQNYGRGEDPSIQRARNSMATKANLAEMPFPEARKPQEPTSLPMEPSLPESRLGRRILTQRPERRPDFVFAKLSSNDRSRKPLDCATVECATCGATVEIPKSAVVLLCPNCDRVHPAATCRYVRAGQF